jgi:hypothetical protein
MTKPQPTGDKGLPEMNTVEHRLHHALSEMISVVEVGGALPIDKRKQEVRLQTKGACLSLLAYDNDGLHIDGAKSAAHSARTFLINEITQRIHSIMERS